MFACRQKGVPVLMDSEMEDVQQKKCFEKIQTYRLVRDNVVEYQNHQLVISKEQLRHNIQMYGSIQVSES